MSLTPSEHDFHQLLSFSREELIRELLETCADLANDIEHVGFLRAEEVRSKEPQVKAERLEAEGHHSALDEKKWVIIRLLDLYDVLRRPKP